MSTLEYIFCDVNRNRNRPKAIVVLTVFRIASIIANKKRLGDPVWILGLPFLVFYRIAIEWILGIELPPHTRVGEGLVIEHGQALVVNDQSIIGANVTIRQSTTIGCKVDVCGRRGKSPIIGDNVDIGSNVVILGDIKIGSNSIIGAGSVVVKDVPNNSVVVGNPARIIGRVGERN